MSKIKSKEIYQLIVLIFSLISWLIPIYGIVIMSCGLCFSLLLKKFRYVLPWILNFVFTINIDISLNVKINPILYIFVSIVLISLVIYSILKKSKINVGKSKMIYLLMSVVTFIPILWTNASKSTHLLVYLSWFLYTIIYLFTIFLNDEDNKEILVSSMINLGLLISIEVIIISLKTNGFNIDNILSNSLRVGWGIFNECGIMLLVVFPYLIYHIHIKHNYFLNIIKLIIILIACFFTNSRGTYIFGLISLILLGILHLILMKKNKKFYLSIISITILFVFTCLIFHTKLIELTNKIITFVFYNGLSSNGRFELYNYAINRLFSNPKYALFGLGFVESYYSDFGNQSLAMKDIFLVYHSTIIQTLSIGGIIGLLVFIVFIYKRYIIMIKEFNNPLYKFLFIGLLPVEAYGLIDNTYHMFYFMIPLVISMGIFETHNVRKDKIMC